MASAMIFLCFTSLISLSLAQSRLTNHAQEDLMEATHLINNAMMHLPECKRERPARPVDCEDLARRGYWQNGVYTIWPRSRLLNDKSIDVYCDMRTDGGGWTVIQRRGNFGRPADYFYQDWAAYKKGFGDIEKDFWLGNDLIYALTNQRLYSARFDLVDWERNSTYAQYGTFWIDNEEQGYRLNVDDYTGTAGDSLIMSHNGQRFTTKDRDNDSNRLNCAQLMTGAWWYRSCHSSNLNGWYYQNGTYRNEYANGIDWRTYRGYRYSLMRTEIKIRSQSFKKTAVNQIDQ